MLSESKVEGRSTTPIVIHKHAVPNSSVKFTTACFAGEGGAWSMSALKSVEDVSKNHVFAADLETALKSLGGRILYGPSPVDFNGQIIEQTALSKTILLGEHCVLYRNKDAPADGTFLRTSGEAGVFSASGCGLIVAVLDGRMIFAHAGRDCLIDRAAVLDKEGRRNESVVDSIVEAFLEHGLTRADLPRLHAWMLYSIKPEEFLHRYDDVQHRHYNNGVRHYLEKRGLGAGVRALAEGVELDLPIIANLQLMQYGVTAKNIHLEHRYLHDELPTTRSTGGRYLVAIVRHT